MLCHEGTCFFIWSVAGAVDGAVDVINISCFFFVLIPVSDVLALVMFFFFLVRVYFRN